MSLQLFNTLSGRKDKFEPLNPPEVRMYTCGPTVYDYAHIGNFRTYVCQDLLCRYLNYKKYHVTRVMNVTDIDDKTIAGALREGTSLKAFTEKSTEAFLEDSKSLDILPPHRTCYATEYVHKMVDVIRKLIENGHAYEKDGSVYFRVASFPKYGQLSKKDLSKNIVGARVDQDEYEKEEGADFVLWKRSKENELAIVSWNSPWGKGRPGWHIECSVMSLDAFDWQTLDIHTGGEDLVFPHHENEIAQSESVLAPGKQFVKYWFHVKHLLVDGEKMSKSKGNFFTLRDLMRKGCNLMAVRYLLLSAHYRKQLNFTLDGVKMAREALTRARDFMSNVRSYPIKETKRNQVINLVSHAKTRVEESMDDDLNSPEAIGAIFELIKSVNTLSLKELGSEELNQLEYFFTMIHKIFGVFAYKDLIPAEIELLVRERQDARKSKDFNLADQIRDEIKKRGYWVEDAGDGVKVKKIL